MTPLTDYTLAMATGLQKSPEQTVEVLAAREMEGLLIAILETEATHENDGVHVVVKSDVWERVSDLVDRPPF